jgi:beta propeller repeat protein
MCSTNLKTCAVATILFLLAADSTSARIITVDDDGPADFNNIQAAINDSNDDDIVLVEPGRYYENINFLGKAITVSSTNPDDPNIVESTIIDGSQPTNSDNGSVVAFANGEGRDSVLQGLTLTGGAGTHSGANWGGGGVYCYNASPTISDNIVVGNIVQHDGIADWGGALWGRSGSNPLLYANKITSNSADSGGAVYTYQPIEIRNNIVCHNTALSSGGGLYVRDEAIIVNNVVYNNVANAGDGGGIYLRGATSSTVTGNTIVGNSSGQGGANLDIQFSDYVAVANNIITEARNGPGVYLYETSMDFKYNDVWNNAGGNYEGVPDQTGLNGNISVDPVFADRDSNDFHLAVDSPCVNAGDPNFVPDTNETDIDGEQRVLWGRVDMGADERGDYPRPVADAGPDQYLDEIQLLTLDGSGSIFYDPGAIKQYQWTQIAGPNVALSDWTAMQPTFMPEIEAEYRFELIVSDGTRTSAPDEVLIVAGNRPAVANAGPNTICLVGERVTLDGTGSYDLDPMDVLSYSWRQVQGPNVVLVDPNTPTPYFDCNENGLYAFELIVNDGFEDSEPGRVEVACINLIISQESLDVGYSTGDYFHYPDVSGAKVVYGVGSACDFTWDIKCKDLTTGIVTSFAGRPGLTIDTQPSIDGDILVWCGGPEYQNPWGHEPSNVSVFARNIRTGTQRTLRPYSWSESYSHPAVSGNKVVWLEHLNLNPNDAGNYWWDTPYNICGADISNLSSPVYFTIDSDVGTRDPYPCYSYSSEFDHVIDISADRVVWEAHGDIYGADISDLTDIKVFPICTEPGPQFDPAISGNIVIWTDRRNDVGDIYGADISDTNNIRAFEVVRQVGIQEQPAIDGSIIVYAGTPQGPSIYARVLGACYLTSLHGVMPIPLDSSGYTLLPAIDGEIIVWQTDTYGKARGTRLRIEVDTDGDGMPDDWELDNGLNPWHDDAEADLDGDGLINIYEYANGSRADNPDTDGDGLTDYEEVTQYGTNPSSADSDSDGLTDFQEVRDYGTNPLLADTDGDGLTDSQEVNTYNTNPLSGDTDGDGMPDGWEVGYSLNPLVDDSQDDDDDDGLTNIEEYANDCRPNDSDSDNDGMPDGWEVSCGLNPRQNDAEGDADGDGYSNIVEFRRGSVPTDPNSLPPLLTFWVPTEFASIQSAINLAINGDTVVLEPGTYSQRINFVGKNLTVRSTNPDDPHVAAATIIDGCGSGSIATLSGGEDKGCIIEGLTLTNGNYAIHCQASAPTIRNCIISQNASSGIHCLDGGPTITGCVITDNEQDGLYFDQSSPTVADCMIGGNAGFGICCTNSNPVVAECNITANGGGGIRLLSEQGDNSATIINCAVVGNTAHGINSYESDMALVNCLIAGNKADGIHAYSVAMFILTNCSIVANAGEGIETQQTRTMIGNSIIRDNLAGEISVLHGLTRVSYSDVEGGWPGTGNVDADPCFVKCGCWGDINDTNMPVEPDDPNAVWLDGDYHLRAGSPCIDHGDNAKLPLDTYDMDGDGNTTEPIPWDLDCDPRLVDGNDDTRSVVDMGAYEYFVPPIEVTMRFTPQAFNPGSEGNWFKLHFVLPDGYDINDVNLNTPAQCTLMDTGQMIESGYLNTFVNEEGLVEVEAGFERSAFALCLSQPAERILPVMGLLAGTGGQDFCGTDTVKIINNTLQQIAAFASYWLAEGCDSPDWCNGLDLDRNGKVNFADFALFHGCCIQVVPE